MIQKGLFGRLSVIPGVVSVSIVGSFCDSSSLLSISDIDTIVVVESLTAAIFNQLKNTVLGLRGIDLGLPEMKVLLNDGFGPRKFDGHGHLVIHLMVYDRAGHREHVLKSPFTCLDWERSEIAAGVPLSKVYPVVRLQPRDFFEARRGLLNYLQDLRSGTVSCRQYQETPEGGLRQVESRHPLDASAAGEFAFHILKFLVGNYAKLLTGKNVRFSSDELCEFWSEHLPACAEWIPFYLELERAKRTGDKRFPPDTLGQTQKFLDTYSSELNRQWTGEARRLIFFRHGPTALNDGSYLGQRRDPEILSGISLSSVPAFQGELYSSPLARAVGTAGLLRPTAAPILDARLSEIDYGDAEGLAYQSLCAKFPAIHAAWQRGEDVAFPGGENTRQVLDRLQSFLREWAEQGGRDDAVVTHNVVLRTLLGSLLGIPMTEWHFLPVPHLEAIEVLWHRGGFYLNLAPVLREKILDAIAARRV